MQDVINIDDQDYRIMADTIKMMKITKLADCKL